MKDLALSSHSYVSDDESDSNSIVVKNKHKPYLSDESDRELELEPEPEPEPKPELDQSTKLSSSDDETPVLSADFSEDYAIRLRTLSSSELSSQAPAVDDSLKNSKGVSVTNMFKNVWNRRGVEEGKGEKEKEKKKEGDEKTSKFSKYLPKAKKEANEEVDGKQPISSPQANSAVDSLNTSEEGKDGGKKKWEIDQRIFVHSIVRYRCYRPDEENAQLAQNKHSEK